MLNYGNHIQRLYDGSPPLIKDTIASAYAYWTGRKKYGGAYNRWRRLHAEMEQWDRERMHEFQIEQLQHTLSVAAAHSPYFARLMNERGLTPGDGNPLEQLKAMPIIGKNEVREHYGEIVTSFWRNRHLAFVTSGTTGTPLKIPLTEDALQRESAARWHFITSKGIDEKSRHAQFTGQSLVPISRDTPPFHVRDFVNHALMCSVYHMSDSTLAYYLDALESFRPVYIYGYPSALHVLATFMKQTGRRIASPAMMFACSEKLHEYQRMLIQEMFSAPLYQWYGQSELTVNAYECEYQRLHVKEGYGLLELLRDDGSPAMPGEPARAVATCWGNQAFPLIRYDTGDRMVLSADQSCRCGRSGRILEEILGRDEDFIVTGDGRFVGRLTGVFCDVDHVREGQIIQDSIDRIVLKIVPGDGYSKSDEQTILSRLREYLGTGFVITVELVDAIPRARNGKMRHVISKVPTTFRK